jgi:hypothetical protein
MAEPADEAQYHEARFLALISGLAGNAMQHLGKVMNPLTGQIERNLDLARETIDLLRMLREKTKGNLSDREKRSLDALLSSLQLNYVDEARADAQKAREEPKETPPEVKKEEKVREEVAPAGEEQKKQAAAEEEVVETCVSEDKPKAEQSATGEAEPDEESSAKKKRTKRGRDPK